MIKLLLLFLLMGNNSYSAVSFNQAQQTFKDLERVTGVYTGLYLSSSNDINAASSLLGIQINKGMLEFIQNKDELALVLGHELSHTAHMDTGSTFAREYRADKEGFFTAGKAGYNSCRGALFLKHLAKVDGNEAGKTHPKSLDRYQALVKYCK